MKHYYHLIIKVLMTVFSAAVIFVDIHSYRKYRDSLIMSEQKQLLTMAETVGQSLENEIENELKKLDLYFISYQIPEKETAEKQAELFVEKNKDVYTDVSFSDDAGSESDAVITGKYLADSGWYELEIEKCVQVENGYIRMVFMIDLHEIYLKIVEPVKIGEGGYSVVKDRDLAIIMHHAISQIGMDAIYDRKEKYPQLDLSSLEKWLEMQRVNNKGTSVIDTYVWDDPDLSPVKRIVAFTTIRIQQEEWIVNSTLPINELDKPLSNMLLIIMILTTLYFVIIAAVFIFMNNMKMRSEAQEKELNYLKEINHGMEVVSKQNDEIRHYQRTESLGLMASHIAHEFNNYLTPIMVYAELLENEEGLSAEGADMAEEILSSAERAANLSSELLDFSRQDSGIRLREMNLKSETEEAVNMIRKLVPSAITFSVNLMDEDMDILGRDGMMQHILLNLCKNAFQAMENSPKKELTVSLEKKKEGAVLKVQDTGSGITRDAIERIFEPFYTTKGSRQGTGLGLSVIRNIMHSVNGSISVESTPDVGTCFILSFPEIKDNQSRETGGQMKKAVVITDNEMRKQLEKSAEKNEKTEFFCEEMSFLSKIQKNPDYCDSVLSSYILQNMNGIEMLEIVQRLNPEIRRYLVCETIDADLQWYENNRIIDKIILKDDLESFLRNESIE